jgi:hypothetical protein
VINSNAVHLLSDGGKHRDHADAGDRARRVRPQHFFKNNYLFKQWTDADGILDYLDFAKGYVAQCEERYGRLAVEQTLDAAHALMSHGIDRYPGKKKLDLRAEEKRAGERREHEESAFNDLWRTVPTGPVKSAPRSTRARRKLLGLPQENPAVFPGKDRAAPETLAARACCGSCATSRSISIRRARPR